MKEESIKCVKCHKILTPNKDDIMECAICHKKYCYDCSLDYTFWKAEDIIQCKKCALEAKGDWSKSPHIDKTDEPI